MRKAKLKRGNHSDMKGHYLRVESRKRKASERKGRLIIIKHQKGEANNNSMVSNKHKTAAHLHDKLQGLRSITNSHSLDKTSIILDATKYIEELKQKVERLNQDIATAETSKDQKHLPMVTVETLEKGFLINVYSGKSCPGLLVPILEVLEEMGLSIMEARVSCSDTFQFQAVGGEEEEEGDSMDAEAVTEAVGRAIKDWRESTSQQ